jgi:ribonucleoside-diphosphate reductase alpha chain
LIEKVKGKNHLIIKRDGRTEKYSRQKMKKAILWCCDNSESLANELLDSLNIKIFNKIKIEKLWEEVISTAANKISEMYPIWDKVAKKAYLLKIYKETHSITNEECNIFYGDILKKGVTVGVYNKELIEMISEEEIIELDKYIDRKRDLNFTFIGLVSIMEKYSYNATKTRKLELPQHIYMRLAIFPFIKEKDSKEKLKMIKRRYDDLSLFRYTEATPKVLNSLSNNSQMASCVLSEVDDNIESINDTDSNMGVFSKYGGGLACDISKIRSKGSSIGKGGGVSSGPIPFIKKFESTVNAYDQNGVRKGSCVITFPFWHMDVLDLLMLKDEGGSDENRARKNQYAIKWYKILTERIKGDKDITLFDPKETPELNELYGEKFKEKYLEYENKTGIRKKTIKARQLAYLISKIRAETGNLYITFVDNINLQRMGEEPVFASNLCAEIVLPANSNKNFKSKIIQDFGKDEYTTEQTCDTGEIALCNLSSINIMEWIKLSVKEKEALSYNLLRAADNLIDLAFYPVKAGELANKNRRPIGVGISNYANYLASKKVLFTDDESLRLTHEIMEDITYYFLKSSNELAKERGPYKYFRDSKWAKGILPLDLYKKNGDMKYTYPLRHDWDNLREEIKEHGVRFSYHFAIAPTATSGMVINATEGIDPVRKLFTIKSGTYDLPVIVPNLKDNRMHYQNAFDVPNKRINDLGSVRQRFLDQSQSVSHFYKETKSSYEIISDIMDAEEKGQKSLYYLHPMKAGDINEGCESCSS